MGFGPVGCQLDKDLSLVNGINLLSIPSYPLDYGDFSVSLELDENIDG